MYIDVYSIKEVAEKFGVTAQSVRSALKRRSISLRGNRKGEEK